MLCNILCPRRTFFRFAHFAEKLQGESTGALELVFREGARLERLLGVLRAKMPFVRVRNSFQKSGKIFPREKERKREKTKNQSEAGKIPRFCPKNASKGRFFTALRALCTNTKISANLENQ